MHDWLHGRLEAAPVPSVRDLRVLAAVLSLTVVGLLAWLVWALIGQEQVNESQADALALAKVERESLRSVNGVQDRALTAQDKALTEANKRLIKAGKTPVSVPTTPVTQGPAGPAGAGRGANAQTIRYVSDVTCTTQAQ